MTISLFSQAVLRRIVLTITLNAGNVDSVNNAKKGSEKMENKRNDKEG